MGTLIARAEARPRETRTYHCYPVLASAIAAVLTADVLALGALAAPPLRLPWPIESAFVLVVAAAGMWLWLVCVASAVRVDRDLVRFEALVASGQLRVARVRAVRPIPGLAAAAISIEGRLPLVVAIRPGFAEVAAGLSAHPCRRAAP